MTDVTVTCACAAYRAAEMGAPVVHEPGDIAPSGNCMLTPCLPEPTASWVIGHELRAYDPDEPGPRIVIDPTASPAVHVVPARRLPGPQLPQRQAAHLAHMHELRRQVNVHNDPDIVNRLVRLVEELLERDDVRMDADTSWYAKQLRIIKAEINAQDTRGEGEAPAGSDSASQEE